MDVDFRLAREFVRRKHLAIVSAHLMMFRVFIIQISLVCCNFGMAFEDSFSSLKADGNILLLQFSTSICKPVSLLISIEATMTRDPLKMDGGLVGQGVEVVCCIHG